MKSKINPEQLRINIQAGLPGEQAHCKMASDFRENYEHTGDPVPAAVLILLYPFQGSTGLVFIKRNEYDGPHSAQVSFPGGAMEPGDKTLEAAALRETREELGIMEGPGDQGKIEVLGALTPLHIPVSNFLVHPFAGWTGQRPVFHPDPSEVQYVVEATLEELLDASNILWDTWEHHGRMIRALYYHVGQE